MQDQEYTITDVIEGKEYLFRVIACNKCGPGEPAYIDEPVNVSSPASKWSWEKFSSQIDLQEVQQNKFVLFYTAVPDPPENLKWRDKSSSKIFLSWEPPKWDGGAPIKGYTVDKCQRGTDKWEPCGDALPELK